MSNDKFEDKKPSKPEEKANAGQERLRTIEKKLRELPVRGNNNIDLLEDNEETRRIISESRLKRSANKRDFDAEPTTVASSVHNPLEPKTPDRPTNKNLSSPGKNSLFNTPTVSPNRPKAPLSPGQISLQVFLENTEKDIIDEKTKAIQENQENKEPANKEPSPRKDKEEYFGFGPEGEEISFSQAADMLNSYVNTTEIGSRERHELYMELAEMMYPKLKALSPTIPNRFKTDDAQSYGALCSGALYFLLKTTQSLPKEALALYKSKLVSYPKATEENPVLKVAVKPRDRTNTIYWQRDLLNRELQPKTSNNWGVSREQIKEMVNEVIMEKARELQFAKKEEPYFRPK